MTPQIDKMTSFIHLEPIFDEVALTKLKMGTFCYLINFNLSGIICKYLKLRLFKKKKTLVAFEQIKKEIIN